MMRLMRGLLLAAAAGVVGTAALAPVTAQDKPKKERGKKALTFEVYKDKSDEFRWRLKSANGQNIGTSGQGYAGKADCMHAIEVIKEGAAKANVKEVTDSDK